MNNERTEVPTRANRNYRDTLFRMIFREPKELLELYNAVNDTDYTDESQLEIVTLENAVYMNMKNDVACLVDCRINLYEQQASVNPNMPLRNLLYVAKEYESTITKKSLYSSSQIKIPTPSFVVFYNGTKEQPERLEMKLSDAFEIPVSDPALELKVIQLNITPGHNQKLMQKCPTLYEYSQYVDRVHRYSQEMTLDKAVERAVQECIKEGILADFLLKNRAEAISVSIFEYDEERELALLRADEREAGVEIGQFLKLISQVRKKSNKGMTAAEIAEMLEEDEKEICNVLETIASTPDASDEEVAKLMSKR